MLFLLSSTKIRVIVKDSVAILRDRFSNEIEVIPNFVLCVLLDKMYFSLSSRVNTVMPRGFKSQIAIFYRKWVE